MNAFFMVISAIFTLYIFDLGYTISQLFLITAILSTIVITYLCIRQPEYYKRFLSWIKP